MERDKIAGAINASPERPIRQPEEDKLDRGTFVARLCRSLIDEQTKQSSGVVVGVTGPWGSGKSSIINLLHEYITREHNYPNAVVFRFDPWLISGRHDLIEQFFADLAATIKGAPSLKEKGRELAKRLASYGAHLAPIANIIGPGFGSIFGGGIKAVQAALDRDKSLYEQRNELGQLLAEIEVPIVILIDELDRTEDEEIRAIAQLVRAVANFENISYLLAYDQDRVIEALGGDNRGRAYLEKIVQFQIPLPVAFDDELYRLLKADLDPTLAVGGIPPNWETLDRVKDLVRLLIPDLINTPRDVARLAGTFHVLEAMVRGEVHWVDLLGYCALLVKAPGTAKRIYLDPDLVSDNPLSESATWQRMSWEKKDTSERIAEVVPAEEQSPQLTKLLTFLFPSFDAEGGTQRNPNADAIWTREVLLTVLRLSLLPGHYSREVITAALRGTQGDIEKFLRDAQCEGRLDVLMARLHDIFHEIDSVDHLSVWLAFSKFLRKPDAEWFERYDPVSALGRSAARLFERLAAMKHYRPADTQQYFNALLKCDDITLVSYFIRTHIFRYGLFGREKRDDFVFLGQDEVEALAVSLSQRYQKAHLKNTWLSRLWDLTPVFIMIDTDVWDEECRVKLGQLLEDDKAAIGFTLLLFGGILSTENSVIENLVGYEYYKERIRAVRHKNSSDSLDPSVRTAISKALGERL